MRTTDNLQLSKPKINYEKIIIATVLLVLLGSANAQTLYIQGGVNMSNINTTNSILARNNKLIPSFNAGGIVLFSITKSIAFETGLLANGKGSESTTYLSDATDDHYIKTKFTPLYFELPANVVYRLPLPDNTSGIFIHAGPYVAMGFGGKSKVETKSFGRVITSTQDIQFNNNHPTNNFQEDASYRQLRRFDYGVNIGAGFNSGKVLIKANYGLGLADANIKSKINRSKDTDSYRVWSLSLGIPLKYK